MSVRRATLRVPPRDQARERRITDEIVVDAYGPQEQAMGWYYDLQDRLEFPFTAVCVGRRQSSPLQVGDEVDVVGMADEDECEREMFVALRWGPRAVDLLAVPLAQLGIAQAVDEATVQAVEDWHYWVARGYRF